MCSSNAVKTHNVVYFIKNFGSWKTSCRNLIKYNRNDSEENDEEEKVPINIEFTNKKTDPYNDENSIDSK